MEQEDDDEEHLYLLYLRAQSGRAPPISERPILIQYLYSKTFSNKLLIFVESIVVRGITSNYKHFYWR